MIFDEAFINQVKQSTDMLKLVQQYTDLKHVSGEIWQGVCPNPDHQDDTPSLCVWTKKQSWACMACHFGKKGQGNTGSDCFAFIQWIKNVSWKDAVIILANEADIHVPDDENQKFYDLNKLLSKSYRCDLHTIVHNYLINRGLEDNDIDEFAIGFNGSRIVFPLFDRYKNILGFSSRLFENGRFVGTKYRNSANSKHFQKGSYLYGIHLIDHNYNELRITEGTLDVILPVKYGVKNIVATLGTAFTDSHVELIKHLNMTPVFCMDADEAGLNSINKSIEKLADVGIYSKILILPDGYDMADLANSYKEQTEQYIQDNSMTYGFYKIRNLVNQYDAKIIELRIKFYPEILRVLNTLSDPIEKQILLDYVKEKVAIDFTDIVI